MPGYRLGTRGKESGVELMLYIWWQIGKVLGVMSILWVLVWFGLSAYYRRHPTITNMYGIYIHDVTPIEDGQITNAYAFKTGSAKILRSDGTPFIK